MQVHIYKELQQIIQKKNYTPLSMAAHNITLN